MIEFEAAKQKAESKKMMQGSRETTSLSLCLGVTTGCIIYIGFCPCICPDIETDCMYL